MERQFLIGRLLNMNEEFLGTGFFVSTKHMITCRHVIQNGIDSGCEDKVIVDYLGSHYQASWHPLSNKIDATLLTLESIPEATPKPAPYSTAPLPLQRKVDIHGFNAVAYGRETLSRSVRSLPEKHGCYVLDGSILKGFSGSPACVDGQIVGIVVAEHEGRTLIWPIDSIFKAFPDILPASWKCSPEVSSVVGGAPFQFVSSTEEAKILSSGERSTRVLFKKMEKAGLSAQFRSLNSRTIAAENRLLELNSRYEEDFQDMLNQLEEIVKGECDEAFISAEVGGGNFSTSYLNDIYKRLSETSRDRGDMVYGEQKECLIGLMGLLAGDCQIWFGPQFDLGEEL